MARRLSPTGTVRLMGVLGGEGLGAYQQEQYTVRPTPLGPLGPTRECMFYLTTELNGVFYIYFLLLILLTFFVYSVQGLITRTLDVALSYVLSLCSIRKNNIQLP